MTGCLGRIAVKAVMLEKDLKIWENPIEMCCSRSRVDRTRWQNLTRSTDASAEQVLLNRALCWGQRALFVSNTTFCLVQTKANLRHGIYSLRASLPGVPRSYHVRTFISGPCNSIHYQIETHLPIIWTHCLKLNEILTFEEKWWL